MTQLYNFDCQIDCIIAQLNISSLDLRLKCVGPQKFQENKPQNQIPGGLKKNEMTIIRFEAVYDGHVVTDQGQWGNSYI